MRINLWRQRCATGPACQFLALAVLLFFAAGAVSAVEVPTLYAVEVELDPQDPDARQTAERAALLTVLIRVTGTMGVSESPEIAELFPNPAQFVLRRSRGPANSETLTLDGEAIERRLRQAALPIWGSNRPLTLALLGVDWGQGEREIVAAIDANRVPGAARSIDPNRLLRERVEGVATTRGVPLVFPLLDSIDMENLSFTDIWGGFDEPLWKVAERYGADSILVGRIRPDSEQENRWSWYHAEERRVWTGEPEFVVNLLADSMGVLYAVGGDAVVEEIRVTVGGVNSVTAYAKVQRMMENLRGIDRLAVKSASADTITYLVSLQGGAERLDRELQLSGLLERVQTTDNSLDLRRFGTDEGSPADPGIPYGVPDSLEYLLRVD